MARLVVIDDDPLMCQTLADLLGEVGHEVETALDGETGLRLMRERRPDLVVCDVAMADMNGYDVLRSMRKDPSTSTLPLIFLTGFAGDEDRRRGMNLGADDYLTKPIRRDELVQAIAARLARRDQVHQELRRRMDELRASIARSMPQEFLTPLTAVLGLSEFLVNEGASLPSEMVAESARGILDGGRRLHALILKFILYAELEATLRDPKLRAAGKERLTLDAERYVTQAARGVARERGRDDDLRLEAAATSLCIGSEHLEGLVRELIENACAFSKTGSPISLTLANADEKSCLIEARDEGKGMSAEEVARLGAFVQFGRPEQQQPGTGLGFAIVERLVELYDARLDVRSVVGEGTRVRVWLRRAHASRDS
jgi:two-component system sensor histidine kinase/response regulator